MHIPSGAHIHMIAICGTAMGALAAMLREKGYRVTGSDNHVYPPMSTFLKGLGIEIQKGFAAEHLGMQPDLVIIGNAVSRGNPEAEATLDRKIPYMSLPEVLRDFFIRGRRSVVITGTHGKTTTTALTAHLLARAGLDPSFVIAGLPHNFDHPYHLGKGEFFVVEGDEYDSAFFAKNAKFFFYLPEILIINNIEFDHADIYSDLEEIKKTFAQLINILPQNGLLLANHEDPVVAELMPGSFAPVQTFGLGPEAHWRAVDIKASGQGSSFTLHRQDKPLADFILPLSGTYNIRNALAAIGVGMHAGLSVEQLEEGLRTFKGIKRRQEVIAQIGGITLIDDFAHHPTAVEQALQGLRQTYPGARFWVLFEPASATNARAIFEERYLRAFSLADNFVITKVPRPERARQDRPLSPERIVESIRRQGRSAFYLPRIDDIVDHLLSGLRSGDVVVLMSNGGFGGLQSKLLNALKDRFAPQSGSSSATPPGFSSSADINK